MQSYVRTWREGPRRGLPKASGLVLVRLPLLSKIASSGTNLYPQGVWFADVMLSSFSCVTFVLFRFRLYTFIEVAAFRSVVLRYAGALTATRVSPFFLLFILRYRFFRVFLCHCCRFLFVWRVLRTFSLPDGAFLPCDHGLGFICISLCENSTTTKNQS